MNEWENFLGKKKNEDVQHAASWAPPPAEFIKINVDASFKEATKSGGWGVLGRDSSSVLCVAAAGPLEQISDAMHAEACALSNAIQIADQMGMGRVIFETDCLNLKHAMTTSDYYYSPIGNLISDLKFRLHLNFIEARVSYAPRICNKPAHELAALGVGGNHSVQCIWTENFPNSVTRPVTDELVVS